MKTLRVSIVGDLKGPDIFELIDLLGIEEIIKRLEKVYSNLENL